MPLAMPIGFNSQRLGLNAVLQHVNAILCLLKKFAI